MAFFKIKAGESYAAALSFMCYFCVLGAYYVIRPIRDQLAVEVGSVELPWFFAATFLATLLLTPLFSLTVSRWPRHIVIPTIYMFFIACQLGFIFLYYNPHALSLRAFGMLFFVWVSIFNLFVVSIFWSFMDDIWGALQARRLFPIIGIGGTLGAILGPLITASLVEILGSALLLLVSSGLILIAIACVILLNRWASQFGVHRNEPKNEAAIEGGMWDGLKQIFLNPFIGGMACMMLLNDGIGTIAYALVTDYSGATFSNQVDQTRFAAYMDFSSNILQVLFQLTVTRLLLIRYGAGAIFIFCPFIVAVACLSLSLAPQNTPIISIMPPVAVLLILTRSLAHGMLQPAQESLYTLVSRNLRYKGKNAVDTVVWRAGDVLSLLSVNGLRMLNVSASGFEVIWAIFAALSGWIGWKIAKQVEK